MTAAIRSQINSLTEDIIKYYNLSIPIQNITEVIPLLGGCLQEDETMGVYSEGRIDRTIDNFYFKIIIPYGQSAERKNYTIAHALGHLFLCMGYMIDDEIWNKTKNINPNKQWSVEQDLLAKEFATALLMPRKKYAEIVKANLEEDVVNLSKVAFYFNVSIDEALYRGRSLGYFN